MLRNVWGRWARTGLPSKKDLKDNFYLNRAWAPSSLVVNCYSGVAACEESPISQVEVGLGPDGALEEGQQDVRDGLDGAEDQGVAATVHSRVEGKGTGLALREVGWADASCGSFFQEVVTVISAGRDRDRYRVPLLKLTRIQGSSHRCRGKGS